MPELALDAAFRARLLDQVRAAAEIGHPHILPVSEAGDAAGIVYITMRYVQGGDAQSLLSPLGPTFARSTPGWRPRWMPLMHGVIHGGVKPPTCF